MASCACRCEERGCAVCCYCGRDFTSGEAARLRRDLSEALGLLRAHQRATTSSGDDPGWRAWDAAVAALLAKYPP